MPAPTIATARLILRPVRISDAGRLRETIDDHAVAKWLTNVPNPYSLADAMSFIAHCADHDGEIWAITDADGLQGMIGVEDDFGYWLGRTAWGRGYATEAGRAVVAAWFADVSMDRLASSHFVGNDRSRRVLEKLGFEDSGPCKHISKAQGRAVNAHAMILTRAAWRTHAPNL